MTTPGPEFGAAYFEPPPAVENEPRSWRGILDAAYCISLQSRPDRAAAARAELARAGLLAITTFYRPPRHPQRPVQGIWESHRAVARHALERGLRRVLILEDDVCFRRAPDPARLGRQLDRLPDDWRILFLGHWPFRARFVARDLLAVESACAHAYIAGEPLLRWLAGTPFGAPGVSLRKGAGKGIDSAYSMLPGCYAIFPMLAVQGSSPSDHFAHLRVKQGRKLHHRLMRALPVERFYALGMRGAELLAVLRALPGGLARRRRNAS
ncbi:MAG: hypothetical protein ACOY42_10555 [Pseudomonadota bacterium]